MDRPHRNNQILTSSVAVPVTQIMTAAANIMEGGVYERYESQYKDWQNTLWAYYATIGEYAYAMDWKASMASRIHLRAAILKAGQTKPEFLEDGPYVELVRKLINAFKGGEAALMSQLMLHTGVPGVGYLVGEQREGRGLRFSVKSAREITETTIPRRDSAGNVMPGYRFQVQEAPGRWRVLPEESLVGRIFDPDPVYSFLPTSLGKSAMSTLQEIDLYNRRIVAVLLSRIAFNGFLLIPEEVTLPVNPQFKDAPDPFLASLVETASRGIKDPGTPHATIPIPLRVKSNMIEMFKHLTVASDMDKTVVKDREAAIKRLGSQLAVPSGVVEGVEERNHWNAWVEKEDAVEGHLGPDATNIVNGLTEVYLEPMALAANLPLYTPSGDKYIIWYDLSDLIAKPDNAENATKANETGDLKQERYLESLHFSAEDAPSDDEFKQIALRRLALKGTAIPDSLLLLYPDMKAELDKINPPPPVLGPDGQPGPQPGQPGSKPAAGATSAPAKTAPSPPPRG